MWPDLPSPLVPTCPYAPPHIGRPQADSIKCTTQGGLPLTVAPPPGGKGRRQRVSQVLGAAVLDHCENPRGAELAAFRLSPDEALAWGLGPEARAGEGRDYLASTGINVFDRKARVWPPARLGAGGGGGQGGRTAGRGACRTAAPCGCCSVSTLPASCWGRGGRGSESAALQGRASLLW
jgi:hypothetical protein